MSYLYLYMIEDIIWVRIMEYYAKILKSKSTHPMTK